MNLDLIDHGYTRAGQIANAIRALRGLFAAIRQTLFQTDFEEHAMNSTKPAATQPANTPLDLAIAQIKRIQESYAVPLWRSQVHEENWLHDVELIYRNANLRRIVVRLLDRAGSVVMEIPLFFSEEAGALRRGNQELELELPVLRPGLAMSAEINISLRRKEPQAPYWAKLRLNWGSIAPRADETRHSFVAQGMGQATGGVVSAAFKVAGQATRTLVVTQSGARGFAFARDTGSTLDRIFLLPGFAPPGTVFSVGQRLKAIVVQTPKGPQAREIQPLA